MILPIIQRLLKLFTAKQEAVAHKEMRRWFAKEAQAGYKGQPPLLNALSAGLKLQHELDEAYLAELAALTKRAQDLKARQDEAERKLRIHATRGKIKDL